MQRVIEDESRAFEESLDPNSYLDFTVTYRMNHQRASHILALQVKNVLGNANHYGYFYNYQTESIDKDEMVIMLPSISYKIHF